MTVNCKARKTRPNSFALLLFALGACGSLFASDWRISAIDSAGGARWSVLRADDGGNLHESHVNADTHQLRYMYWDRIQDKWYSMTVDERCGGFSSMTLDSRQHPHISYLEYGTGHLKYASWDGGKWTVQTIQVGAKLLEYYTSIALDRDDHPIITYYEIFGVESLEFSLRLRTAMWNGRYWETRTIDATSGSGKFNSVARNQTSSGHVQTAYANVKYENASLRYAIWNGANWESQVIQGAQASYAVFSVSLTVDKDDTPHIAYTDVAKHYIKYATKINGRWQFEVVDVLAQEAFPDRNAIELDDRGNPYISYYDAGRGLLKLAHRDGSKWAIEVVDQTFSGFTSSVQFTNGDVFITYSDSANGSLKCARRRLDSAVNVSREAEDRQ